MSQIRQAERVLREYKSASPRGYQQDLRRAARRRIAVDSPQFARWQRNPNYYDLKPVPGHSFDTPRRRRRRRSPRADAVCPRSDAEIDALMQRLLRQWKNNPKSGGSNNSITLGGLKRVLAQLNAAKPFTKQSVFLDMGSGAGIPPIYAALKYGITAYGVEIDPELVEIARQFAREACVDHLVRFVVRDFGTLQPNWLRKRGVSHVFTFDGVFAPQNWNQLFDLLAAVPLVGASVSKWKHYWSENLELLATIGGVPLAGGRSSFNFGVWRSRAAPSSRAQ